MERPSATYGYDDADRMTKLVNPQNKRTTLGYDAAGRQTLQVHGNSARTTQAFDAASRLTVQIQADGVGVARRTTNLYDANGRRTLMNESGGVRTSWIYDASGQLKREQRNGAGSFDVTHVYDPGGNRTVMIDSGTRTTATYDAGNELLVEKTGAARTTYQYDANGNTTRKDTGSALTIYDWDVRNRMTAAQPVGAPVTCTYSGDNKRVKKEVGATTRQFLYDYENLLRESDGGGSLQQEYTSTTEQYGDLLSAYDGTSSRYYEFDPQYSTEALLDDTGSVTDRYKYRAYGLASHPTGATTQPHTFVGRQRYYADTEIDLYILPFNVYDPVTGRWRKEDEKGYRLETPNLYGYCHNDPINRTDPSGLDDIDWRKWGWRIVGVVSPATALGKELAPVIPQVVNDVRNKPELLLFKSPLLLLLEKATGEELLPAICKAIGEVACDKNGLDIGKILFLNERRAFEQLFGGNAAINIDLLKNVSIYIRVISEVLEEACKLLPQIVEDPESFAKWFLNATGEAIGGFIHDLPSQLPNWLLEWFFQDNKVPKPPVGQNGLPQLLDPNFLGDMFKYLLMRAIPSADELKNLLPAINNGPLKRYIERLFAGEIGVGNLFDLLKSGIWKLPSPKDLLDQFMRMLADDLLLRAQERIIANMEGRANDAVNMIAEKAARAHPLIATVVWLLKNAHEIAGVWDRLKPGIKALEQRDAAEYTRILKQALVEAAKLAIDALATLFKADKLRDKTLEYLSIIRRTISQLIQGFLSFLKGALGAKAEIVGIVDIFQSGGKTHNLWVERRADGKYVVMIATAAKPAVSCDPKVRSALDDIKKKAENGSGPTQAHWNAFKQEYKDHLVDIATNGLCGVKPGADLKNAVECLHKCLVGGLRIVLPGSAEFDLQSGKYHTDEHGRLDKAEVKIEKIQPGGRRGQITREISKLGEDLDVGFHLLGDRFGGSTYYPNVIPANGKSFVDPEGERQLNVNLSAYKTLENYWEKALRKGKFVVTITFDYGTDDLRPTFITIEFTLTNGPYKFRWPNSEGAKIDPTERNRLDKATS